MCEKISQWKIEEIHPTLNVKSKRLMNGKLTYIIIEQNIVCQKGIVLEPEALPKLIEVLTALLKEDNSFSESRKEAST